MLFSMEVSKSFDLSFLANDDVGSMQSKEGSLSALAAMKSCASVLPDPSRAALLSGIVGLQSAVRNDKFTIDKRNVEMQKAIVGSTALLLASIGCVGGNFCLSSLLATL
jgi:hypothetical protein